MARAERLEIGVHRLDIALQDRGEIGVHDGGGGAGVFAHLRVQLAAHGQAHVRHHLAHDFGGAGFVVGVQHRPDETDRHRLHALAQEVAAGVADVILVQRRVHLAVRQHAFRHTATQVARNQHGRGRIFGVIAVAVFLVAQADLDAVLMAARGDQAGPGSVMGDQRVQSDRGAVDAQIGIRHDLVGAEAGFLLDQLQAVADRGGGVVGGGQRLEDAHAPLAVGKDEIGEGAARVDAETILVLHGIAPFGWLEPGGLRCPAEGLRLCFSGAGLRRGVRRRAVSPWRRHRRSGCRGR